MAELREHFTQRRGLLALWTGVLAAPIAFLLNLQVTYTVVTLGCANATPWLHLSALLTLLLAGAGGWIAWREWRRTGEEWPGDGEGVVPRSRFLSFLGILTSVMFGLIILAQWIPMFILDPCRLA